MIKSKVNALTENESKLIEMIRNHPNPVEAIVTAIKVIQDYQLSKKER